MKLRRNFPNLAICVLVTFLHLQLAETSILKKLQKKLKETDAERCWEEKVEHFCTTTYEKECAQKMIQQCETTHTKQCTVDYKTECVTESEEKCVMENEKKCKTEHITECWEEEEKDCRTKPKCNTVLEEVCSTTYTGACYGKKQKRDTGEDRDDFVMIDPALAVAVDILQKMSTKDILKICDKSATPSSKGEAAIAYKYVNDFLDNEHNEKVIQDLVKRNMERKTLKRREAEIIEKLLRNPQKLETAAVNMKRSRSARLKRSPGLMDYVEAVLAGYEEDCEEDVPRDHCVKVPVEKCHDEQTCEFQTHEKCEEVPHEQCWEEPKQRCWQEPKQRCWQEPHERCWQEPQNNCWEGPIEECHEVPREKCEDVKVQVETNNCESNYIKPRRKRENVDEEDFNATVSMLMDLFKSMGVNRTGE